MDCSPPGSSVQGISQARILECSSDKEGKEARTHFSSMWRASFCYSMGDLQTSQIAFLCTLRPSPPVPVAIPTSSCCAFIVNLAEPRALFLPTQWLLFFFFFAIACIMWNLRPWTRNQTCLPWTERKGQSLNHWTTSEVPQWLLLRSSSGLFAQQLWSHPQGTVSQMESYFLKSAPACPQFLARASHF